MSENKKVMIGIIPHADDEIYLMGSFLTNFDGDIHLICTHLGDMSKNKKRFDDQSNMLEKSLIVFNELRAEKGFGKIYAHIVPREEYYIPKGLNPVDFHKTISLIEEVIGSLDKVDYYVFSSYSTHQNHKESYDISEAVMRSPYLSKINCILEAHYPNDFAVGNFGNYTAYQGISNEDMKVMCEILDGIYQEKVVGRNALSSESFKVSCRFFGNQIDAPYAMSYQVNRVKL